MRVTLNTICISRNVLIQKIKAAIEREKIAYKTAVSKYKEDTERSAKQLKSKIAEVSRLANSGKIDEARKLLSKYSNYGSEAWGRFPDPPKDKTPIHKANLELFEASNDETVTISRNDPKFKEYFAGL